MLPSYGVDCSDGVLFGMRLEVFHHIFICIYDLVPVLEDVNDRSNAEVCRSIEDGVVH